MPHLFPHTLLLAARHHLAGLQVLAALRVLIRLTEPKFNPGQLRVPAGKPHGGQWTKPGDHGGGATVDGTGNGPAVGDGEVVPAMVKPATNIMSFQMTAVLRTRTPTPRNRTPKTIPTTSPSLAGTAHLRHAEAHRLRGTTTHLLNPPAAHLRALEPAHRHLRDQRQPTFTGPCTATPMLALTATTVPSPGPTWMDRDI